MNGVSAGFAITQDQEEAAFAGTLRAMDTDNFHRSQAGILVAVAVLVVWVWWLFSARISISEVSGGLERESPAAIALRAAGARNR